MIFFDPILFAQFVSGLSRAMILFIMASGLTLVFGVMRVINFAHGSFYMVGAYLAFTVTCLIAGSVGFWAAFLIVPAVTAILGGLVEVFLLRRIYEKEHLLQMLLTFGLIFVFSDLVRIVWGVDLRMVSLPSYLAGYVTVLGHQFPVYHLFVIGLGAAIAVSMWFMLTRTNFGKLMRGAAEIKDMVELLGYPANRLFTIVFMMATFLGGLAGATIAPAARISLGMDTEIIAECFTIAIIGGLGNVWGALLGALIAGMLYSFGILVLPNYAMAFIYILGGIVIVIKPTGLLGKSYQITGKTVESSKQTNSYGGEGRMRWYGWGILAFILIALPFVLERGFSSYYLFLATKVIVWILFATSFNLSLGYGGMMSLSHGAFFGLGAYTCSLLLMKTSLSPVLAMLAGPVAATLGAMVVAAFSVRVQGAFFFATLTIAFCQLAYTIAFKWRSLTNGDDGLQAIPVPALLSTEASYINLYFFATAVTILCLYLVYRIVKSPYGLLLRALKEDPIRATFIGMNVQQYRFIAFVASAFFAGVAGVLYAFLETSVAPEILTWTFSGDVVLMSLLGGMHIFLGPAVGAAIMVLLSTFVTSYIKYWLITMGTILVLIVLFCPNGVAGLAVEKYNTWKGRE